jgi:hypothetical protein
VSRQKVIGGPGVSPMQKRLKPTDSIDAAEGDGATLTSRPQVEAWESEETTSFVGGDL